MKKGIMLFVLLLIAFDATAKIDTIRYWNPNGQFNGYNNVNYAFAAFYPEAPCYIKAFNFYVFGQPGQVTAVLLDHQAGSPLAEVFIATNGQIFLGAWNANANPQQGYMQGIRIELPEPIWFADNHFFVGVHTNNPQLYLATDQSTLSPVCESNDGGNYYYQSIFNTSNQWSLGAAAFCVDVEVEYPNKTPANYFVDVTESLGLPTNMSNGTIAWADINGDGWEDLLVSGRLFINNQGESFTEKTTDYGLSGSARGNAFLDIDNDDDLDMLFLNSNASQYIKSIIYENNRNGTFTPHELSIPWLKGLNAFSIADVDNNRYPDLFVAQLWSEYPNAEPNYMLFNEGSMDFVEIPLLCQTPETRRSRGSQFIDFDNDGDLDLYVTNYYLEWDELWENRDDGNYYNIIESKNIDVNETGHNHGTGVDWYDYDNDGDMDLLLPQFAHPRFLQYDHRGTTIYRNSGAPNYTFTDTYNPESRSSGIGITYEETHAGAAWGDADNDGLADFVTTTFYGCRYIDYYKQKSDHTFENMTFDYGLENIVTGTDACWVDFDNDGRLDLSFGTNYNFRLFRNNHEPYGNFIEIDLKRMYGYKVPDGALVRVFAGNDIYTQEVGTGRGQLMQKPTRLHFGLGENTSVDKVQVHWPNYGRREWEEYTGIENKQIITLTEGQGEVLAKHDEIDFEFSFQNITPNPVQSAMYFNFFLSENQNVIINIYDIHGSLVGTVYNGTGVAGLNRVFHSTANLRTGSYYCRIFAGKNVETAKFIVVK